MNRATSREHFENRLWKAQRQRCSICTRLLLKGERFRDDSGWNLDHVFPRSRYARLGNRGNLLLVHRICNTRKADREPTGCEILLLHAVNAALGHKLVDPAQREWRDNDRMGPSAIALAWQRVVQRQAEQARA
jgi:5-methylcytosine-specific restriction endonuclease McrA